MIVLKIFNVHDTKNETLLSELTSGEHVVGRGLLPNCTDRNISRRHVIINIKDNDATFTVVHVTPVFYMSSSTPRIHMLKKDDSIKLSDGDKFAFLIDAWYVIKIEETDNQAARIGCVTPTTLAPCNTSSEVNVSVGNVQFESSKRSADDDNLEDRKKIKLMYESSDDEVGDTALLTDGSSDTVIISIKQEVTEEGSQLDDDSRKEFVGDNSDALGNVKQEPLEQDDENLTVRIDSPPEVKKEPENDAESTQVTSNRTENDDNDTTANIDKDGSSNGTGAVNSIQRENCWYGPNCYRKNAEHRSQFSHPGDSDYRDSSDDSRPSCPYGAQCYRRNEQHRRDYRHPTSYPAPMPSTSKQDQVRIFNIFRGGCPYCSHCKFNRRNGGNGGDNDNACV